MLHIENVRTGRKLNIYRHEVKFIIEALDDKMKSTDNQDDKDIIRAVKVRIKRLTEEE